MAMFNSYVSLQEGIPFSVDSVVPHIYMLEVGPWSNLYEWPWTYMKLLNYINTILLINHIYLWINYVRASIYTYLTIYIYTLSRDGIVYLHWYFVNPLWLSHCSEGHPPLKLCRKLQMSICEAVSRSPSGIVQRNVVRGHSPWASCSASGVFFSREKKGLCNVCNVCNVCI